MPTDPSPQAALETLAALLDPGDYATTLTTGGGQPPSLSVASRHAQLGEDIYAGNGSYWWSWAEPICGVDDPATAAHKITSVLWAAPEPTRG